MTTDVQDNLDALAEEREQQISDHVAAFEAAIVALIAKWQEEIENLIAHPVNDAGQSRIRQLAYLTTQVSAQLNRLGYTNLAREAIGEYDEALHAADAQLAVMGIPLARLAPINEDALRALKEIDFQKLLRLGSNTTAALVDGIVQNVIEGLPRKKIAQSLETTLGQFAQHALTYVDTGMNVYGRYVNWEKFATAVGRFKYRGPLDIKTRPFCRAHVGNVYTKDEILHMDNGSSLGSVWLYCGGWNCRHFLSPYVQTA